MRRYEICWTCNVETMSPFRHGPQLMRVCEEVQHGGGYHLHGPDRKQRNEPDHILYQIVLDGQGHFEDRNGYSLLKPGMGFFTNIHDDSTTYWHEDDDPPMRLLYAIFLGKSAYQLLSDWRQQHNSIVHLPVKHPLIRQLQSLQNERHVTWSAGQSVQLFGSLLQAWQLYDHTNSAQAAGIERCQKAISFMDQHQDGSLSVQDIAEHVGVTREAISRDFKIHLNDSPAKAYLRMRLETASRRLIASNDSQEIIAQDLGWPSASHFSRAFKRLSGMSPGHCRDSGQLPLFN